MTTEKTRSAGEAGTLAGFRAEFYRCLTGWADAAFELTDAVLCLPAPVHSVPSLSLEPVFRRGHGSLYKALARGGLDAEAMRDLLVAYRPAHWPAVFAVDTSSWPRCDAETSPERGFYYSASRHSAGQPIVAGWSYQWITQLCWASDSWTAPVDARRIPPTGNPTDATAAAVRDLVNRLERDESGGPSPMFVFDAGYDPIALTDALRDVRADLVVRIRSDRVFYTDPAPDAPVTSAAHAATAPGSPAPTRPPGPTRIRCSPATTRATGPCTPPPGAACIPSSPAVAGGPAQTPRRSWPAPSSASPSNTFPNPSPGRPRRCGYG